MRHLHLLQYESSSFWQCYLEVLIRVSGELGAVHIQTAQTFHGWKKRQTVPINHSPFTHIQTHFNTLATLNTFVVVVTIAPLKIAHSHSALCNKSAFCVCSLTAESQQTGVSDGSLTQVQNLKTGQMLG